MTTDQKQSEAVLRVNKALTEVQAKAHRQGQVAFAEYVFDAITHGASLSQLKSVCADVIEYGNKTK